MEKELIQKLKAKKAVIGVVGLGYVGLPLSVAYAEEGYPTIGFDIDQLKVDAIAKSECYLKHFGEDYLVKAVEKGFYGTTDFSKIKECDAIILCVPTPLNKYREPDLSYITGTMDAVCEFIREGQVLSLESTTYPGTTDEALKPYIDKRGFKVGDNYFLIYSPERENPGSTTHNTRTIPKVCGGHTNACLNVGKALYEQVITEVVPVTSTKAAEMTKLLENIHRAVNIGLVNEMKVVADKMDIDIYEVINAAATKPFGFVPYFPGPGLGGHCIPIDPFYLTWKAREYGVNTRFIELAGEVNSSMPEYVISKVGSALNSIKKNFNGSKILVLGLSYKKNVDDMRESPSVEILDHLVKLGANVDYHDPLVPTFPKMREYKYDKASVEISKVKDYDCVLLATDHDCFDYEKIYQQANLIIDTRGRYSHKTEKIVRA
jgi:UDP-N-acetyl-D-glucosamine dehydrogenase